MDFCAYRARRTAWQMSRLARAKSLLTTQALAAWRRTSMMILGVKEEISKI